MNVPGMKSFNEALGIGDVEWPQWVVPLRDRLLIGCVQLGVKVNLPDILGEGLYLGEEAHAVVVEKFLSAGYPHVCTDEVGYIITERVTAVSPEGHRGLMYAMADDEPDAHVWVTFDMR